MAASLQLAGQRVAILVANGFEQIELTEPRNALQAAGAKTLIVSPESDQVHGWQTSEWGDEFPVDVPLEEADPAQFESLLLPGGVMNPDRLRARRDACDFIRAFFDEGKPVAAICHGAQTLIEIGAVAGRHMTSYPSIKTDLQNAGAHWVDEEAVVDHGLVTSRSPADLAAFNRAMIEEFAHRREHVES